MSYTMMGFIAFDIITTFYIIQLYNRLIGAKNDVNNMMGSIDAILKKRFDLIPNLVMVVQQYSTFERSLLEKLTALRSQGIKADMSIEEKGMLSNKMSSAMREFTLTVENYPSLKANQSFLHLQQSIAILEEELSAARRVYNQSVTDYNNRREMFPSNIMAHFMKLKNVDVFSTSGNERDLPSLKQLFE